MIRKLGATLTCAFVVLLVTNGCVSTKGRRENYNPIGLVYQLLELHEARPNRVHILRVDLDDIFIQPAVAVGPDPDGDGPAETTLTDPFKLAKDKSVIAFINTNPWDSLPDKDGAKNRNWFEGQPVDIQGLAVSGGQVRSPAGGAPVCFDERGSVCFNDVPTDKPVAEGVAGFQQIVKDGVVIAAPGGPLHPRTAIGADRTGTVMWLVVVDGRQEHYSEGMTLEELGNVMLDLGCWSATNMDGGGSSIMALAGADGRLHVVNSPSDRLLGVTHIRPLPMILTIKRTSGSKPSATTGEATKK